MTGFVCGIWLLFLTAGLQAAEPVIPYESPVPFSILNGVDRIMAAHHEKEGIRAAWTCSDSVFIRRIFMDVTGTMPAPAEVRAFLESKEKDKRQKCIESLFGREEYADYWALKWGDLLRIKSEFPINLWPNGVQAYHRWVRDSVKNHMPYDQFARSLLSSSGSNFRVPPVNFFRAVSEKSPKGIASAVALTFMGTRIDSLEPAAVESISDVFRDLSFKKTAEWKEEIVYLDPGAWSPRTLRLPDGKELQIAAGDDPRAVFAQWLTSPENPWFARAVVNRVWYWLMGEGIVHEPDDFRSGNPPSVEGMLEYLSHELIASGWDLRAVFRLILSSSTYQQSSIAQSEKANKRGMFGCYRIRRHDAEVLIDAINWIARSGELYTSPIPEPFTYVPEFQRSIELSDGSITSSFLDLFGRPARDSGLETERNNDPTEAQLRYLLNSAEIQRKLQSSQLIAELVRNQKEPYAIVSNLYLNILSRFPSDEERSMIQDYLKNSGIPPRKAMDDLVWALINSKEFLYRH